MNIKLNIKHIYIKLNIIIGEYKSGSTSEHKSDSKSEKDSEHDII